MPGLVLERLLVRAILSHVIQSKSLTFQELPFLLRARSRWRANIVVRRLLLFRWGQDAEDENREQRDHHSDIVAAKANRSSDHTRAHRPAAVAVPCTGPDCLMMVPPMIKPIPVIGPSMIRACASGEFPAMPSVA